ncbi:MAG: DF family (seleno)protein [Solirubrobacteraceae bacterium]
MRIELLWWEGCPSQPQALSDLRSAMAEMGLDPETVEVRQIETDSDAQRERFIGSPTIRIDGIDIAPADGEPYGLNCRVYHRRDGRISPTPDPADLRDALSAAMTTTSERT